MKTAQTYPDLGIVIPTFNEAKNIATNQRYCNNFKPLIKLSLAQVSLDQVF